MIRRGQSPRPRAVLGVGENFAKFIKKFAARAAREKFFETPGGGRRDRAKFSLYRHYGGISAVVIRSVVMKMNKIAQVRDASESKHPVRRFFRPILDALGTHDHSAPLYSRPGSAQFRENFEKFAGEAAKRRNETLTSLKRNSRLSQ